MQLFVPFIFPAEQVLAERCKDIRDIFIVDKNVAVERPSDLRSKESNFRRCFRTCPAYDVFLEFVIFSVLRLHVVLDYNFHEQRYETSRYPSSNIRAMIR